MFDPFDDFDTNGYLRNIYGIKDSEEIKRLEHSLFTVNIIPALEFLQSLETISYEDFLKVHELLFIDLYPWAGQDRSYNAPQIAVKKGKTIFSHPLDACKAVSEGLRMAENPDIMRQKSGTIMGLFAYGHPFLDGNGRTMLVVHTALANRAGFSIDWHRTTKNDYLNHLSSEIENPNNGILDDYLKTYIGPKIDLHEWSGQIITLPGLDGLEAEDSHDNSVLGKVDDPKVISEYEVLQAKRNYEILDVSIKPS